MNNSTFPESFIRGACNFIYGRAIASRTWQKYKAICKVSGTRGVPKRDDEIPKENCLWLLCLCYLKREQREEWQSKLPLSRLIKGNSTPCGKGSKIALRDVIKALNSPIRLPDGKTRRQAMEDALGDSVLISGVLGKDVPAWLEHRTGKRPHISTLRKKAKQHGKKFSVPSPVPTETLDLFLDLYLEAA